MVSGGSPSSNGTNLLAALASITTASASSPWLLKIEPGLYDLGSSQLVAKAYVDFEGSGRESRSSRPPRKEMAVRVPPFWWERAYRRSCAT